MAPNPQKNRNLFNMTGNKSWFSRFAKKSAYYAGVPGTFMLALLIIIIWGATGPLFHFNDTWQLVINTSTTIITFLMVFLIQNAQNRDSAAVQLKLDELIRATGKAHNSLMDLEELEVHQLEKIKNKYVFEASKARKRLQADDDEFPGEEFDIEKGC